MHSKGRAAYRLAVMFGSAARGTARSDSDVDVGVLLDDDDGLPALRVAIERAVDRSVDLVSLRTAPPLSCVSRSPETASC